eukprot:NODE_21457_length_752_cov_3.120000.p1 GENE.NODE_21457_length_752_cov_3.120000~~NODE_21457_length_752_cov_3.120000.p1  ORF type:complete len:128 (-),score=27.84 NODE_21457_length_752_cov_3.120000:44-427(-)
MKRVCQCSTFKCAAAKDIMIAYVTAKAPVNCWTKERLFAMRDVLVLQTAMPNINEGSQEVHGEETTARVPAQRATPRLMDMVTPYDVIETTQTVIDGMTTARIMHLRGAAQARNSWCRPYGGSHGSR